LYFNLPFSPIIRERIEPQKIFPIGTNSEASSIQAMLEAFEEKQSTVRQANVIIMKVENEDKD
jgi:hypothetical protein